MNIKPKELEDMLFISDIMGLANELSAKDHGRIKRLLDDKANPKSPLRSVDDDDTVSPRIISALVIMEFAIKQLSIIVPTTDEIKESGNKLMSRLPTSGKRELVDVVEKIRKVLQDE